MSPSNPNEIKHFYFVGNPENFRKALDLQQFIEWPKLPVALGGKRGPFPTLMAVAACSESRPLASDSYLRRHPGAT